MIPILSEEVINKLVERLVVRIEKGNEYVLSKIGQTIKEIGTLSPADAKQISQIIQYGGDYDKIVKKLAEITNINVNEIYQIFDEVVKNNYSYLQPLYEHQGVSYVPYEANVILRNEVKALAKITADKYVNIMNTLAFSRKGKNGRVYYTDIGKMYQEVVDTGILNISEGKETFDSAMGRIVQELGESGIRTVDYESGRSVRLDSAVRMHLQDGITNLHMETQKIMGEEFDADGVEISVHGNPAPDHALVQGRQFSNEEFKKFQNDLDARSYDGILFPAVSEETGHDRRSIGQYNCYHDVFPIVLGVSKPEYTDEQLQDIIDESNKTVKIDGKEYTKYECSQLQRRIENEVRKEKEKQIIAKESGVEGAQEIIDKSQQRVTELTNKYVNISNASGLPTYMDRMRVSNYNKVKTMPNNYKEIEYARKNNSIWHSTENIEEIINDNKIMSPSIAVGKKINTVVKYGTQFIEFKPELLENVNKNTILYNGDGGNAFTKPGKDFKNLMQMLKNNPKYYNELKFNDDLEILKYIKKVYIRDDETQRVIDLLKENNILYETYKGNRIRTSKKKK